MADLSTTVNDLKEMFRKFVAERDWEQFHSPKNLAMSLAVEAAELMEHFLWMDTAESNASVLESAKLQEVGEEIADIAGHIFCLCNVLNLDLSDVIAAKMSKNALKYPADIYRGKYRL